MDLQQRKLQFQQKSQVTVIPLKEESNGKAVLINNYTLHEVEGVKPTIKIQAIILGEIQGTGMITTTMMVRRKREDILATVVKHPDINQRVDDTVIETTPN